MDERKKKLELALFSKDKDLAFFLSFQKITDLLQQIAEKELPQMPETKFPDVQTVKVDGLGYLKGEPGDTPTDEHIVELIKPLIPDPIPGEPGYTPKKNRDYFDGIDGIDGKDAPVVDEEKIIDSVLNKIPPTEPQEIDEDALIGSLIKEIKKKKLLDISDIKNSGQFLYKGTKYNIYELMHGGSNGSATSSITYSVDLSAQADGVNKVFTVPTNTSFILLTGTDAPFTYRPIVDYTGTGTTTLTLDALVNAPSSGSTLILTYVN